MAALIWALAAMHWRTGKRVSGATYAGLRILLGITDRVALFRLVRKAQESGVVVVERVPDERNRPRPHIMLTHATLTRLESLWRN